MSDYSFAGIEVGLGLNVQRYEHEFSLLCIPIRHQGSPFRQTLLQALQALQALRALRALRAWGAIQSA